MPTTGPNFGSSDTGTGTLGGGTASAWTNPNNANAADGVFTTSATTTGNLITKDLNCQGFGFTITGSDTINGITVEINRKSGTGVDSNDSMVQLLKAGALAGVNKATGTLWPAVATTVTYGGVADLWVTTWTSAQINAANFGIVITAIGSIGDTVAIDFIRITITSTSVTGITSQMMKMFQF